MFFNLKRGATRPTRGASAPSLPPPPAVVENPNITFFRELFTPAFISEHTDFPSMRELIRISGFRIETVEDISRVPEQTWDAFIESHTRFGSWEAMQQAAFAEWSTRKLGV